MSSVQTARLTSEDDFEGYWLVNVNIVRNSNDALNYALKSTEEKVLDSCEAAMRGIRDMKVQDYYVEQCMRPYKTSISVGNNDKETPASLTKPQKRGWLLCCIRPKVKT